MNMRSLAVRLARVRLVAGASLGALAAAGCVLVACGTPPEDTPRLVSEDELQFADSGTTTSTSTSTTSPATLPATLPAPDTQDVKVYFVDEDDLLVPVERELRTPTDLPSVLTELLEGPDPLEQRLGLRSTLPRGAVTRLNVNRGVAEVTLMPNVFDQILPGDQVLAFAQLVLTLTAQPGIGQVEFSTAGEPISVQKGDGSLSRPGIPLSFEDYEMLLETFVPPASTDPTTTTTSPRTTTTRPAASTTTSA
jgi:Sporulation and spore germination